MDDKLIIRDVALRNRHCVRCNELIPRGSKCFKMWSWSVCNECMLLAFEEISSEEQAFDIFDKDKIIARKVAKKI